MFITVSIYTNGTKLFLYRCEKIYKTSYHKKSIGIPKMLFIHFITNILVILYLREFFVCEFVRRAGNLREIFSNFV